MAPNNGAAYVGKSAFAHKGGMHVAAIRRNVDSYQHIDPALVGNEMRVLVSDLSGRGNMLSKAEEYGLDLSSRRRADRARHGSRNWKTAALSSKGRKRRSRCSCAASSPVTRRRSNWSILWWWSSTARGAACSPKRRSKCVVDGEELHTVAEGNGPVERAGPRAAQGAAARLPAAGRFPAGRLQGAYPGRRERHRGPDARPDRHPERHAALEHGRREYQHHRGELARAGRQRRIRLAQVMTLPVG